MSERVTLARGAHGPPVAHKTCLDPDDRARLRHEATMLRAARHPGVVSLVAEEPDHLVLGWVGAHTLATTPQPELDRAVALTIAVATTLADLHQIGISHGAVDASHILLDHTGRPVLCSFSQAELASSPADAAHRERSGADVMALGEVLGQLLREVGPTGPRRLLRHRYRAVTRLAERAASDPPSRRLSARALAGALADAVPASRSMTRPSRPADSVPPAPPISPPAEPEGDGSSERGGTHALAYLDRLRPVDEPEPVRRRSPRRPLVAAAAGLGLALLAGFATVDATASRDERRAEPPGPPPTGGRVTATTHIPPVEPGSTAPSDHGSPIPSGPCDPRPVADPEAEGATSGPDPAIGHHDTDGDGCREPVHIVGNTIVVGERRWMVGQPDDVVAVADWDCDGTATPALLRPGSGEVFVFTGWAPARGSIDATATTNVPSAVSISPDPAPCPSLVVTRADGSRLTLPAPTTTPETTP